MMPEAEALFDTHLAWAEKVARDVRRGLPPSFDLADLEQVARIEHWRRVQLYNPAQGVPYQVYAYPAVRGAVLMACRRRHWRDATGEELNGHHVDERLRPDEALLAREERRNVSGPRERRQLKKVRGLMTKLRPADAYLVQRVYLEGVEVAALAEAWHMSESRLRRRVSLALERLRRKARAHGG